MGRSGFSEKCLSITSGSVFEVFVIVTPFLAASSVTKKMLVEFRKHKFEFSDKSVTFSAGIAEYVKGTTRTDFFEKSDKILYKAKKEGKNRVLTE